MLSQFKAISLLIFITINFSFTTINKNLMESTNQNSNKSDSVHSNEKVRNQRYCEIFLVQGGPLKLKATVYNTIGCSDCPEDEWQKIDVEKIKDEFKAKAVILNGPRYFMMDKIGQSNAEPKKVMIGGLEMFERATFPLSFKEMKEGKKKPYEETTINRTTEYVFYKGSRVYEISSPEYTYIMQSYSQIINPDLTEADLSDLPSKIKLPEGWTFKTLVLDEDYILRTIESGDAHILQEDLLNTYQRMDSN